MGRGATGESAGGSGHPLPPARAVDSQNFPVAGKEGARWEGAQQNEHDSARQVSRNGAAQGPPRPSPGDAAEIALGSKGTGSHSEPPPQHVRGIGRQRRAAREGWALGAQWLRRRAGMSPQPGGLGSLPLKDIPSLAATSQRESSISQQAGR